MTMEKIRNNLAYQLSYSTPIEETCLTDWLHNGSIDLNIIILAL